MGRTEKSIKNIVFGLAAQIVTTIITFVTRTIFVRMLGDEINSLNGLFHEIVMNLSLAELGIGSAIVYNLYKPLAEHNEEKVSELMTFFKNVYRIIAGVLLILGTIVCFFVPLLVKDITLPNSYLRFIFMLFVIHSASSYFFSYKIALLNADQKNYVYSFYASILGIAQALVYVVILLTTRNYVVYLVVAICTGIFNNFIISRKVDQQYPYLTNRKLPAEDRKQIFSNVKNIFIKEVSGKITSSTDNILISTIVSTLLVGKYTFYATILTVFKQITEKIDVGVRASMGNLFASSDDDNCQKVLFKLTWGYGAFATFCAVCIYASAEHFIAFWVGEEYILDRYILFILSVNMFCYIISKPIYAAMHVGGYFVEGRNISIAGSVINLVVSIGFGIYTGIFGIFLGTFCTYFIQIVMKIYYVYKLKFKSSCLKYALLVGEFGAILLVLMFVCDFVCGYVNTSVHLADFFITGCISAAISAAVLLLTGLQSDYLKYYWSIVTNILKRKKK